MRHPCKPTARPMPCSRCAPCKIASHLCQEWPSCGQLPDFTQAASGTRIHVFLRRHLCYTSDVHRCKEKERMTWTCTVDAKHWCDRTHTCQIRSKFSYTLSLPEWGVRLQGWVFYRNGHSNAHQMIFGHLYRIDSLLFIVLSAKYWVVLLDSCSDICYDTILRPILYTQAFVRGFNALPQSPNLG